jgi:hypothetical protein
MSPERNSQVADKSRGSCCSGKSKPAVKSADPVVPTPELEVSPILALKEEGGCQCCSKQDESDRTEGSSIHSYNLISSRSWWSRTSHNEFPVCVRNLPRVLLGHMLSGVQVSRDVTNAGKYIRLISEY